MENVKLKYSHNIEFMGIKVKSYRAEFCDELKKYIKDSCEDDIVTLSTSHPIITRNGEFVVRIGDEFKPVKTTRMFITFEDKTNNKTMIIGDIVINPDFTIAMSGIYSWDGINLNIDGESIKKILSSIKNKKLSFK